MKQGVSKIRRKTIHAPSIITPGHMTQVIQNREAEIHSTQEEITSIRNNEKDDSYQEDSKLLFQILNDDSIQQRRIVADTENEISY